MKLLKESSRRILKNAWRHSEEQTCFVLVSCLSMWDVHRHPVLEIGRKHHCTLYEFFHSSRHLEQCWSRHLLREETWLLFFVADETFSFTCSSVQQNDVYRVRKRRRCSKFYPSFPKTLVYFKRMNAIEWVAFISDDPFMLTIENPKR